jgi:hypothetical protein
LAAISSRIDWDGIAKWLLSCRHDPIKWVHEAYPWGHKNTELALLKPRQWQLEQAERIKQCLQSNPFEVIQEATASGHGIGKSCEINMLAQWALMTAPKTRGVITANTEAQLRTKTWPEMGKWYGLLPPEVRELFVYESTSIHVRDKDPEETKIWRIDAVPWSEYNTEAFAGLHNKGKRTFLGMDEASAIADKVWEVAEGALTDEKTEMIWLAYGNPTRTTGAFKECWGRRKHRWRTQNIDSRTVEGTNKAQLQKLVDDYGEESDRVRIRVRGLFPQASSLQFIESNLVREAMDREPIAGLRDPLVMGIDVARGGADNFVVWYRRGMDAKSIPPIIIPGSDARDSNRVIAKITDLAATRDNFRKPDAIFVDETGIGGPIVDRLRVLLGEQFPVMGVQFAGASPNPRLANMRMYIWWQLREALTMGLSLPSDAVLETELTSPEYWHDKRDKVILEPKDEMRERLPEIGSPDRADALAITFAYNIQPRHHTALVNNAGRALTEYDPYARD